MNPLPGLIITQWEEANTQLTNALSNYVSSCLALESLSNSQKSSGAHWQLLALDLDDRIDFLRATAFDQLAKSCSSLARTRNKLTTSIYSLPAEVLSEIFRVVIYAPREVQPLKAGIATIYRRLHTLISVCSVWRDIGLANASFWSIVPIIKDKWRDTDFASHLSLQRSGNSGLHVAADLELYMPQRATVFTEHAARLRSLNLRSKSYKVIERFISLWLEHGVPGSVNELSICYAPDPPNSPDADSIVGGINYIYLQQPSVQLLLSQFIAELSILRISRALLRLDDINFHSLTELRIDNVEFHTYADYRTFLNALSSMPLLHSLQIISVSLALEPNTPENSLSISLPCLNTLYLEDLSPNLLQLTFTSIAAGSYRIVLYVRGKCFDAGPPDEHGHWHSARTVESLLPVLEGVNVSVLLLNFNDFIADILPALPTLRSLFIKHFPFDPNGMEWLKRPSNGSQPFPILRELHISYASMAYPEWNESFKDVVSSHAIEYLTLGGVPHGSRFWTSRGRMIRPVRDDDEIVTWLRSTVPNFRLIDWIDGLPEFEPQDVWQLW